jgi:hypothetical protein
MLAARENSWRSRAMLRRRESVMDGKRGLRVTNRGALLLLVLLVVVVVLGEMLGEVR